MTLPSQFARPQARHGHMFRRRRLFRRRPFLTVLIVLLLLTFGVWKLRGEGGGAGEPAQADALADAGAGTPAAPQRRDPDRRAAQAEEPATERQSRFQRPVLSHEPAQPTIRMGQGGSAHPDEPEPSQQATTERETASSAARPAPERRREREAARTAQRQTAERDAAGPSKQTPPAAPRASADAERSSPRPASSAAQRAQDRMRTGLDLIATNRPVEARKVLSEVLASGVLSRADQQKIREALTRLNDRLLFSPEVVSGDPLTYGYAVRPGDTLARITSREELAVDWRLIQRINRIGRPEAIRAGQNLKLIRGPFHAVVSKGDFRLDLYAGEGAAGSAGSVYIRSFPVGLGEYDSTPFGLFRVRPNSKLINPEWVNPRTGRRYLPEDPENPLGNYWIGLEGVSEAVRDLGGYGIHGTIEPDTIGRQASMGCIRLLPDDITLIYGLLVENHSTVRIVE